MKVYAPRRAHVGRQLIAIAALVCAFLPNALHIAIADGSQETSVNVSNSSDQSEGPAITYGGSTIGITWGERSGEKISTAVGTISTPPTRDTSTKTGSDTERQTPGIAADTAGNLHLTYTTGNDVYYQYKPAGGGWQGAVKVASDDHPNPSRIAVAPNGRIWVVWRETNGYRISFKYSDTHGASWTGGSVDGVVTKYRANMIGINIAVGTDSIPHVVWFVINTDSQKGDIFVADWNGASFQVGKITTNNNKLFDQDPSIAIDKDNVQHVVFRRKLSDSPEQWAVFYASRKPGAGWENYAPIEIMNGDMKYAPGLGLDDVGSIYAGYSKPITNNERRIILLSRMPNQNFWASQTISSGRRDYRPVIVGTAQGELKAHIAYQQGLIGTNDQEEIIYTRYSFGAAPQAINADPVISPGTINTASVNVSFANVAGDPTQVRWRWGSAPTDASSDSSGWQTFSNPMSISLPANATSCIPLTLYAQVRNSTTTDTSISSATVTYDAAVQASASVANPHSTRQLATYTQGAQSGDSAFTRESYINVSIADANDCSGLKSFSIGSKQETWPKGVASTARTVLVDPSQIGQQSIPISITDVLGNSASYTLTYYYDPRSPNDSKNAGAPQYSAGKLTLDGGNTLIQHLTFSDTDVADPIFQEATGRPFWGIWATVSKTRYTEDEINDQSSTLQWAAIPIPQAGANFNADLSLATGQNTSDLSGYAGKYYVYIKFLDGAGNPSTKTLISEPITLQAGYQLPTVFIPLASR